MLIRPEGGNRTPSAKSGRRLSREFSNRPRSTYPLRRTEANDRAKDASTKSGVVGEPFEPDPVRWTRSG
jgi:hypothetical protein